VEIVGNNVRIRYNPSLNNLIGLEELDSIGGYLHISNNESLSNLNGLDDLTSIGNYLRVWFNNSILSFAGIDNLQSIGGNLEIKGNNLLASLTGLDGINPNSINGLWIHDNNSLSYCAVQSICGFLASPGGYISIHDNAPGCNSPQEVIDSCDFATIVEEFHNQDSFSIYPNPSGSHTTINYYLQKNSHVTLKIIDLSGREIEVLVEEFQQMGELNILFDGSGLKSGAYFCTLKTNQGMQTRKIIKL
jgi:hypothetical protein